MVGCISLPKKKIRPQGENISIKKDILGVRWNFIVKFEEWALSFQLGWIGWPCPFGQ